MILRKKEHWLKMLFVWRGSVLPELLPRLLLLFLFASVVTYANGSLYDYKIPLNPAAFTIFGVALALFLGFKNSASYDRFWEGRKLWGALLIDTRSLARQSFTLADYRVSSHEVHDFVRLLVAFSFCLKHQLRKTSPTDDLIRRLPSDIADRIVDRKFRPVAVMQELAIWLKKAREDGKIDTIGQAAIDQNLNKLSEILGGCERIASTPLPYTYHVLLHRTIYLYCFMLPFGLVDGLMWMTPFVTCFIAYTFVAFEAIAEELEDPFGVTPNDLALNAICNTIEISLLEMIGKPTPAPVEPKAYILD